MTTPISSYRGRPLTISDWIVAQARGDGLEHLLQLVAAQDASDPAWISLATEEQLRSQWAHIEELQAQGESLPLYGVPFAAKDNIDVRSFDTTAACPDFAYKATEDAAVITDLKNAGAIVIGKTNLDQFATGLVGCRSPYGVVPNTFSKEHVSGGSSSGSGSVVARGIVPFALGTDTAGSGRVPAGLNNVVGLKPTRGLLSARNVVPACRSLDCVSIFALTVDDAQMVLQFAGVYDEKDPWSRPIPQSYLTYSPVSAMPRIAICENPEWFGKSGHREAYVAALDVCSAIGWQLIGMDFSLLFQLAALLYDGPWVAERFAAIKNFIDRPNVTMDPTVRIIIEKARRFSSVDVFEAEYLRRSLTREIEKQFSEFDAILVPATPTFPTIQDLVDEPILENSRLGTYTNFVNFLDWSALAFPAGFRSDGLPFGLTLIADHWQEQKLLDLSRRYLSQTQATLGNTGIPFRVESNLAGTDQLTTLIAVVGAHLNGLPANYQLTDIGATLSSKTTTSPNYRLYELCDDPELIKFKRPALKRSLPDIESGVAIEVEVWSVPTSALAKFSRTVAAPLSIGPVELADGSWVQGFVCEHNEPSYFKADISHFGGWRNFLANQDAIPKGQELFATQSRNSLFSKVLIANRGEIAVRISATLRKLGIHSVAIYAKEDRHSEHVEVADSAYLLEGNTVSETYLCQRQIIDIANSNGVDAIIPGYGFLSENADFAQECESHGIQWIGPTPDQMRTLGLKHLARVLAEGSGVPLLPGSQILDDIEQAFTEARRIGYPLMVKSTAGGGGIGLQKCKTQDELQLAFSSVQHQGQKYFKDGGVFLEHFIEHARHVEVQIIGDGKGKVRHIGARDCSLQRRHQKVIEESPAALIPIDVYQRMCEAAERLAESLNYRNVGTVEFIYDSLSSKFYFLEVNTRLQVEHPVTETVSGYDLVEEMVRVAASSQSKILSRPRETPITVQGHAIEVRIYAESPLKDFRPSTGQILEVRIPENVRFDTWIKAGTQISSLFDPLLAKLIVAGSNRADAVKKLQKALQQTTIRGIETNLEYLRQIAETSMFESGDYTTRTLDSFAFHPNAIEVVDPGSTATLQDYPGRFGFWHVGIPPSGPMDDFSFRMGNSILGNESDAVGLEFSGNGPTLRFHCAAQIVIVGPPADHRLDGQLVSLGVPTTVQAGQTLVLVAPVKGFRSYLAIKGGFIVPKTLGSASTFVLGNIGGLNGHELRPGDLLPIKSLDQLLPSGSLSRLPLPSYDKPWTLRVLPGPHASPDFFTIDDFNAFFNTPWKVHYNSNRTGVRLTGPKPEWARNDGGEAGLHPSNINDSPYSIGSISFTGDEAVILTRDGPSLGGFVVFATVATAEMWKVGQMRAGDEVRLCPITVKQANILNQEMEQSIKECALLPDTSFIPTISDPIIANIEHFGRKILCRQAGDSGILLEFGADKFDLRTSFHIYAFMNSYNSAPLSKRQGILELTPGVRSLHILYDLTLPQSDIISLLSAVDLSIGPTLPTTLSTRTLSLPFAFEHSSTIDAISRYSRTIRSSAPYLPNNVDFLQNVNGLASRFEILDIVTSATFLVLGLGDVFLGSPCAVPLDPRHRLFGTKYSPNRSFTPEGTVGIGGQYLCIYACNSPGGYQLVGRTIPIWNQFASSTGKSEWLGDERPWAFEVFDQIKFYPISEEELNEARESGTCSKLVKIEKSTLDLSTYEKMVADIGDEVEKVSLRRMERIKEAGLFEQLLTPYKSENDFEKLNPFSDIEVVIPGTLVNTDVTGRCWKCDVEEGDVVEEGQELVCMEAMKMEVRITAPIRGKILRLYVKIGDTLDAGSKIATIG